MQELKRPFILYDAQCTLCLRFKQALEILDKNDIYSFYDLHQPEIYEQLTFLNFEDCHNKVHLVESDNSVYVGKDAIAQLMKNLPGVSKLVWLLESQMGQKSLEVFYESIDKFRKSKYSCPKCKR